MSWGSTSTTCCRWSTPWNCSASPRSRRVSAVDRGRVDVRRGRHPGLEADLRRSGVRAGTARARDRQRARPRRRSNLAGRLLPRNAATFVQRAGVGAANSTSPSTGDAMPSSTLSTPTTTSSSPTQTGSACSPGDRSHELRLSHRCRWGRGRHRGLLGQQRIGAASTRVGYGRPPRKLTLIDLFVAAGVIVLLYMVLAAGWGATLSFAPTDVTTIDTSPASCPTTPCAACCACSPRSALVRVHARLRLPRRPQPPGGEDPDPGAGHLPVDADPGLLVDHGGGVHRLVPGLLSGPGLRGHLRHLHVAGLEHDVQLLPVAHHPA